MPAKRLVLFAAIIVVVALASPAFAQGPKCQHFAGSLGASLNLESVEPGWYGTSFLAIGTAAPVKAALVDTHLDRPRPEAPNDKGLWGGERYLFTFESGDTLVMEVKFAAMFTPAPFMGQYNASGKVVGGTGVYENASGNVTAHGPFMFAPPPASLPPFSAWIAELRGTICGVQ